MAVWTLKKSMTIINQDTDIMCTYIYRHDLDMKYEILHIYKSVQSSLNIKLVYTPTFSGTMTGKFNKIKFEAKNTWVILYTRAIFVIHLNFVLKFQSKVRYCLHNIKPTI
jgi:hypothetical protein